MRNLPGWFVFIVAVLLAIAIGALTMALVEASHDHSDEAALEWLRIAVERSLSAAKVSS